MKAVVKGARVAIVASLAALSGLLITSVALAQVPPRIAAENRAIGARIDLPAELKIYSPLAEQPPYREVKVLRNLVYGPYPRNRLDVFVPRNHAAGPLPVLIYATGGKFTRTIHMPGGAPFYTNVMLWAAKHGMIGVNPDRRYFEGKPWSMGPEDMAALIGWVHGHIAQYGGDPNRVVFLAHAWGGTQLVSYLAHKQFWCCGGPGIAAAALISAPLNLAPLVTFPPQGRLGGNRGGPAGTARATAARQAGRGSNPMFDPKHSDLAGLEGIRIPVFIGAPEFDGALQRRSETLLRKRLCAAGHCPEFHTCNNHNHLSVMFSFNTSDQSVSGPLLAWMRSLGD
jgi:acetyl esterase/lipase